MAEPSKNFKIGMNLALVGLLVWFLASHQEKIRSSVSNRDSIQYWAAGKLLVHRNNPYSVADVQTLESSQGYSADRPLMMRTPPWSVWVTLPEGLLSSYWAWVAWISISLASLVISVRISWRLYGDGQPAPNVFRVAGYVFAPAAACLVAGQIGMLLLLGIMLFLILEEDRPFLAGAALLLPMAKPHIFVALWIVLGMWIVLRRQWRLLFGIVSALSLAALVAFAFDPAIFQHYREMLHQQAIQNEFIPALSGVIRAVFFRRLFWVQFVPMALGLLWSGWFYWKNRVTWSWRADGPAVLIVSLLTTPYSWITDEVVLLPAILQGVLWLYRAKVGLGSRLVIVLFVLLNILLLLGVAGKIPPAHGFYFWSSLVWFSWYWYARSFSKLQSLQLAEPVRVL